MDKIDLIELHSISDERGILTSIELGKDIDFVVKRLFYLHDIHAERGGHAHIDTDQVLICMSGNLDIELVFKEEKYIYHLNNPCFGLIIPRLTYVTMRNFSSDARVLVLANTHYDYYKSLRNFEDYTKFLKLKNVH